VLLGCVLIAVLFGTASVALAMPVVSLDPAPDGTLRLVGSGWRSGQGMVVGVGSDAFPIVADDNGSFEIPTALPSTTAPLPALSVRARSSASLAISRLGLASETVAPNAWAVLFAQSLATGAGLLALSAGSLGLLSLVARRFRSKRPAA
jgi:hypothetical protein